MTIEVTLADIAAARRRSLHRGPISIAMQRITGKPWLSDGCSVVCVSRNYESHNLPFEARDFERRFDAGEKVYPAVLHTAPEK